MMYPSGLRRIPLLRGWVNRGVPVFLGHHPERTTMRIKARALRRARGREEAAACASSGVPRARRERQTEKARRRLDEENFVVGGNVTVHAIGFRAGCVGAGSGSYGRHGGQLLR